MITQINNSQNVGTDELLDLYEVRLLQGRSDTAQAATAEWAKPDSFAPADEEEFRMSIDYMNGNFSDISNADADGGGPFKATIRLQSLLAAGRVKDALADGTVEMSPEKSLAGPASALEVSIAWQLAGDNAEAAKWREKAAAAAEPGDIENKRLAAILRSANPPTASQLDDVVLPPPEKCLLLAALMQKFPEQKNMFAPLVRKMNVGRKPPYQLIKQVLDGRSGEKPNDGAAAH
jgi:hypothetical protein